MIEFLIRPVDADWFEFPAGSQPFRTSTIPCSVIEGQGDARIEIDGCEIAFSVQHPGVQVSFEGKISSERAAEIAEHLRQNVEKVSGQRASVSQISW